MAKKSVALSGVEAGNTAICTVGREGNDLHYRGYDIMDIAEKCDFEEVAYLLIHGKLPNRAELKAYKTKLRGMRGLPEVVRGALEQLPASAHPMDVMRTGVSAMGCTLPEKDDHNAAGARDIADRLMASLGSMLCYWYHWSHNGRMIEVETDDDSIGGHFLHPLHGRQPSALWVRAVHTSLVLYPEHEVNASTLPSRVVAGPERSREELIGVAGDLNRAHRALQLCPDALRGDIGEAPQRHLLALVERVAEHEVRDLVVAGDRARHDVAPGNALDAQVLPLDDLGAGHAGRDPDLVRRGLFPEPAEGPAQHDLFVGQVRTEGKRLETALFAVGGKCIGTWPPSCSAPQPNAICRASKRNFSLNCSRQRPAKPDDIIQRISNCPQRFPNIRQPGRPRLPVASTSPKSFHQFP